MNKQIEEMASQAGLLMPVNGNPYPVQLSAEEAMVAYEKFARLIVEQCSAFCEVSAQGVQLPEYNQGILEGYRRVKECLTLLS